MNDKLKKPIDKIPHSGYPFVAEEAREPSALEEVRKDITASVDDGLINPPKSMPQNFPAKKKVRRTVKPKLPVKKLFFNYWYNCSHDHDEHCVECYHKARKK